MGYRNLHPSSGVSRSTKTSIELQEKPPTSTGTSKHVNYSVSWEHENIKG
jgi:hypothetical protein